MEITRIYIRLVLLAIVFAIGPKASCQTDSISRDFLDNILDANLDNVSFSRDSDYSFIIVNNKRCARCGTATCNFLNSDSSNRRIIDVIFYSEYNLANVLPMRAELMSEIPCARRVLFKFYKDSNCEYAACQNPSPQLLELKHGQIFYKNYGTVSKLIKND
jgi:hypothetical protein